MEAHIDIHPTATDFCVSYLFPLLSFQTQRSLSPISLYWPQKFKVGEITG